jgi:hypothetical protein
MGTLRGKAPQSQRLSEPLNSAFRPQTAEARPFARLSTRQDGYPRNLVMFAQRTFFSVNYLDRLIFGKVPPQSTCSVYEPDISHSRRTGNGNVAAYCNTKLATVAHLKQHSGSHRHYLATNLLKTLIFFTTCEFPPYGMFHAEAIRQERVKTDQ